MKAFRLAIVRQKYRPDGGAERFVSRALEALEQQDLDLNVITREWQGDANPNWHIHLCNPLKLGRISRERGFAVAARALWQKEHFDLVQSHERIPGCDIYRAGDGVHRRWLLQRARLLPEWRRKWLFSNRYHRYVMCAERAMYAAPELKAVICNAEMIKQEIIADFGVPADKITVIYNAIDNQKFPPADEALRQRLREQYQIPQQAHCLIFVGSGFERKGLAAAIRAVAATDSHLLVVGKDKAEKRYRALAQSLSCSDRVHFMGVQKQTLPFYQAADALLLPTLLLKERAKTQPSPDAPKNGVSFWQLLRSPVFSGNVAMYAACSAGFFAWLTGSPFILGDMGYSPSDIGLSYVPQTLAFLLGGYGCRAALKRDRKSVV